MMPPLWSAARTWSPPKSGNGLSITDAARWPPPALAFMISYMCAMNQGLTAPLLLSTSTTRCTSSSTMACRGEGGGLGDSRVIDILL